jgi:hypothetical protein
MAPDFLAVVLHGFLHGVGFMLAVLCFGHPWIAIVIVLVAAAFRHGSG